MEKEHLFYADVGVQCDHILSTNLSRVCPCYFLMCELSPVQNHQLSLTHPKKRKYWMAVSLLGREDREIELMLYTQMGAIKFIE